jgi:PAS domain S-box-containing protein
LTIERPRTTLIRAAMSKAESIVRHLHRQSHVWLFIHALALLIAIGLADYLTGDTLSLDPFYCVPVLLVVWFGNRNLAIGMAVLCASAWWSADLASGHSYSSEWLRIWDTIIRLLFFSLVILAGVIFKQQQHSIRARLDLLERSRRSEAESRESEARFRIMADTAPVMVWMSGNDKLCNFFNRPWLEFTGRTMEQELGNGWSEGVHSEDLQRCLETYVSSFNAQRTFAMEYRLRRADGEYRWVLDNGAPRYSPQGEFLGYIGSCIDTTERRQAELEAARQRNELIHLSRVTLLGELSGSLAHELNQPLTAILNNAQAAKRLLARNAADPAKLSGILNNIVKDDQRAAEVIRRLHLLLTKGEMQLELLDMNELVDSVLNLVQNDLINQSIVVRTQLVPELPAVSGDSVQLQQVLLNLIMNGCDAITGAEGAERILLVRTEFVDGEDVRVSVIDHGCGIPPEKIRQIFEPFFTTKTNGMGLGLAVSRTIIDAHGGRLWATNNVECGTTFHFTLPAKHPA